MYKFKCRTPPSEKGEKTFSTARQKLNRHTVSAQATSTTLPSDIDQNDHLHFKMTPLPESVFQELAKPSKIPPSVNLNSNSFHYQSNKFSDRPTNFQNHSNEFEIFPTNQLNNPIHLNSNQNMSHTHHVVQNKNFQNMDRPPNSNKFSQYKNKKTDTKIPSLFEIKTNIGQQLYRQFLANKSSNRDRFRWSKFKNIVTYSNKKSKINNMNPESLKNGSKAHSRFSFKSPLDSLHASEMKQVGQGNGIQKFKIPKINGPTETSSNKTDVNTTEVSIEDRTGLTTDKDKDKDNTLKEKEKVTDEANTTNDENEEGIEKLEATVSENDKYNYKKNNFLNYLNESEAEQTWNLFYNLMKHMKEKFIENFKRSQPQRKRKRIRCISDSDESDSENKTELTNEKNLSFNEEKTEEILAQEIENENVFRKIKNIKRKSAFAVKDFEQIKAKRSRKRNSLELFHDDNKETFISEDVLTATGKKRCSKNEYVSSSSNDEDNIPLSELIVKKSKNNIEKSINKTLKPSITNIENRIAATTKQNIVTERNKTPEIDTEFVNNKKKVVRFSETQDQEIEHVENEKFNQNVVVKTMKNNKRKKSLYSSPERPVNVQDFEQIIAKRSRRTNSIDMLYDDIKEMFISKDVLTVTGKRRCSKNEGDIPLSKLKSTVKKSKNNTEKSINKTLKSSIISSRVLLEKSPVSKSTPNDERENKIQPETSKQNAITETNKTPEIDTEFINESVVSDKSEETELMADTSKQSEKKKVVAKKKKCTNWAMGIIRKKKLKNKKILSSPSVTETEIIDQLSTSEIISDSDEKQLDENESQNIDDTSDYEESYLLKDDLIPDVNYYLSNENSRYECKICNFKGKRIVRHYISKHPETENIISRLSPNEAEAAKLESETNHFELINPYDEKINGKKRRTNFSCRFCFKDFEQEYTAIFFDHICNHTGEYRYKCEKCKFSTSVRESLRKHYHIYHPEIEFINLNPIYACSPNFRILFGYLCFACNFTQIQKTNIEKHIKICHPNQNVKIVKVNMSSEPVSLENLKENQNGDGEEIIAYNISLEEVNAEEKQIIEEQEERNAEPEPLKEKERDMTVFVLKSGLKKMEEVMNKISGSNEEFLNKDATTSQENIKNKSSDKTIAKVWSMADTQTTSIDESDNKRNRNKTEPLKEKERDMAVFVGSDDISMRKNLIESERLKKMEEVTNKISPRESKSQLIENLLSKLDSTMESESNEEFLNKDAITSQENIKNKSSDKTVDKEPKEHFLTIAKVEYDNKQNRNETETDDVYNDEVKTESLKHEEIDLSDTELQLSSDLKQNSVLNTIERLAANLSIPITQNNPSNVSTSLLPTINDNNEEQIIDVGSKHENIAKHNEQLNEESAKTEPILESQNFIQEQLIQHQDSPILQPQIEPSPSQSSHFFKIADVRNLALENKNDLHSKSLTVCPPSEIVQKCNVTNSVGNKKPESILIIPNKNVLFYGKNKEIFNEMMKYPKLKDLYKCPGSNCAFTTNVSDVFRMHLYSHQFSPVGKYCIYCTKNIEVDLLIDHINKHHSHCLHQCSNCFFRAISPRFINAHQQISHKDLNAKTYILSPIIYKNKPQTLAPLPRNCTILPIEQEPEVTIKHKTIQSRTAIENAIDPFNLDQESNIENAEPTIQTQFPTIHALAEKNSYVCPFCKKYRNKIVKEFIFHLHTELQYFRYACNSCDFKTVTILEATDHWMENHAENSLNVIIKPLPVNDKIEHFVKQYIQQQFVEMKKFKESKYTA